MDAVLHVLFKMIMHDMEGLHQLEISVLGAQFKASLRVLINKVERLYEETEENTHQKNEIVEGFLDEIHLVRLRPIMYVIMGL